MQAILSDIHGNLEALNAVLADMSQFPVNVTRCLGDTVGDGPNPRECLDLVRQFDTVLRGELDDLVDRGITHDIPHNVGTWAVARHGMIRWTQAELSQSPDASSDATQRWHFLRALRPSHTENGILFVHGAPSDPLRSYLFPEDVYNPRKLKREFSLFQGVCFCGHSHLPGYFARVGVHDAFEFVALEGDEFQFHLGGEQVICGVGSVGMPRDGDPRANYALFDGRRIRLRRVSYDRQTTVNKIRSNPDLNHPG
jgi:diadenosine tetraphosphatase ApaH/serine/threonine PP2A family protein phosphatase